MAEQRRRRDARQPLWEQRYGGRSGRALSARQTATATHADDTAPWLRPGCPQKRSSESRKIALSGVFGSLAAVLMLMVILLLATYVAPALAGILIVPVAIEFRHKQAMFVTPPSACSLCPTP